MKGNFLDCTDTVASLQGPGNLCQKCVGHSGTPCRVNPRESDPQTGTMCGTCASNSCFHSPHYAGTQNDQDPSNCDLGNILHSVNWYCSA